MDDIFCPNCKTTKYRKPDLVLMVNVCGHSLCDNCVNRIFLKGAAECPECKVTLRRNNFKVQQFEDASVDKECEVRRKVLAIYNKKENDFESLREYNDYLEEVETIIYNLTNGVDVEQMKLKIERYKEANKDNIVQNRYKISKDEALLEQLIEEERELHEISQQMAIEEEQRSRQQRLKQRDELIDDLMFSDLPASRIVELHRKEAVVNDDNHHQLPPVPTKTSKFSSGVSIGAVQDVLPLKRIESAAELYVYKPLVFDWMGPKPPTANEILAGSGQALKQILQTNRVLQLDVSICEVVCFHNGGTPFGLPEEFSSL